MAGSFARGEGTFPLETSGSRSLNRPLPEATTITCLLMGWDPVSTHHLLCRVLAVDSESSHKGTV